MLKRSLIWLTLVLLYTPALATTTSPTRAVKPLQTVPLAGGAKNYQFTLFDGSGYEFCNRLDLTLTFKIYVVGTSTGCISGGLEEGFQAKIAGNKDEILFVSTNDFGSSDTYTYAINLGDDTWQLWATTNGTTQSVINSGYWKEGTPSGAVSRHPVAASGLR
jgi:hypothetical protein